MTRSIFALFAVSVAALVSPTQAAEFKSGDVTVENPWARATPKGADVGAGYLTIHNNGSAPERLTGGSADFASVEVHEMKIENGVMKMREMKDGLAIPAHGTVKLSPGGYHIMFTHLTRRLTKGETVKATLTFEHAPPLAVEFPVESMGASGPASAKGGMKGGNMGGMKM